MFFRKKKIPLLIKNNQDQPKIGMRPNYIHKVVVIAVLALYLLFTLTNNIQKLSLETTLIKLNISSENYLSNGFRIFLDQKRNPIYDGDNEEYVSQGRPATTLANQQLYNEARKGTRSKKNISIGLIFISLSFATFMHWFCLN